MNHCCGIPRLRRRNSKVRVSFPKLCQRPISIPSQVIVGALPLQRIGRSHASFFPFKAVASSSYVQEYSTTTSNRSLNPLQLSISDSTCLTHSRLCIQPQIVSAVTNRVGVPHQKNYQSVRLLLVKQFQSLLVHFFLLSVRKTAQCTTLDFKTGSRTGTKSSMIDHRCPRCFQKASTHHNFKQRLLRRTQSTQI